MPKLNDHGLGGGGKSLGVPVYPLESKNCYKLDDNGTWDRLYGDETVITNNPYSNSKITGTNIYNEMFFIGDNGAYNRCHKYNVHSKTWTRLADTLNSSTSENGWAVSIGTDIWYGAVSNICKYDTLLDEHYIITQAPYSLANSRACTDGTYIYIFGGINGLTKAYKFEIATNAFTQLSNIPVEKRHHICEYDDGFVYLLGGTSTLAFSAYKYNVADDSYAELTQLPFGSCDSAHVKVGKKIYIISSSLNATNYKMGIYDILNNSYIELPSLTKARYYGNACEVDGIIYVIGGGGSNSSDYNINTYSTGDTMLVDKFTNIIASHLILPKGVKVHTDGDVTDDCMLFGEHIVINSDTTIEKTNGASLTSHDGDHALIGSNYATIGG